MKVYMEHISTLGIYGDLSESNELTYGICLANHVKSLDKDLLKNQVANTKALF